MSPPAVVETLDIFKDRRSEALTSWPGIAVKQLSLQRGIETFSDSIVQGITNRAHRAKYASILQPPTKLLTKCIVHHGRNDESALCRAYGSR